MKKKYKQKKEKSSQTFSSSRKSSASSTYKSSVKAQFSKKGKKKEWNFIASSGFCIFFSLLLSAISGLVVFSKGFNYGIDFAGGTEIQVQFSESVKIQELRAFMQELKEKKLFKQNALVQSFGEENEFLIRIEGTTEDLQEEDLQEGLNQESQEKKEEGKKTLSADPMKEKNQQIIESFSEGIKEKFKTKTPVLRRVDSVGPQVGSELKRNSLMAIFYSLLIILIYVSLRFDYKYAPGAVFCLFHDTLLTLGVFSLFQFEVNLQTLTAILTIIGYSLNDTIVTFDRIRENAYAERDLAFAKVVNRSINEVLSRTLLTSFTTLLALGSMYLISGGVIQSFAFTLGMGVMIGTYSSIYVAAPLVIMVEEWEKRKKA